MFVEEVEGSVSNVIGLPLPTVVRLLERQGIRVFRAGTSLRQTLR